jgi:hypothetical protein
MLLKDQKTKIVIMMNWIDPLYLKMDSLESSLDLKFFVIIVVKSFDPHGMFENCPV